ncbi:hypothetical protein [Chondromyces apiculatus]|uniref:hypothetical protein n=1 Tax=Chondromyces apiculatus TaxID=51 RepID=UPI0012DBFD81|nr:hypothetical protein [Chondromyces apiculatus]
MKQTHLGLSSARARLDAGETDFTTPTPGPLLRVDIATQAIAPFGTLSGKLDGIDPFEEGLLVSDGALASPHP